MGSTDEVLVLDGGTPGSFPGSVESMLTSGQPPFLVRRLRADRNSDDLVEVVRQALSPRTAIVVLATSGSRLPILKSFAAVGSRLPPVVVVCQENTSADRILSWTRHGASDFLSPPWRPEEVRARLRRLVRRPAEEDEIVRRLKRKLGLMSIIGESPRLMEEVRKIPLVARRDTSVLILGESGTGKELVARSIHYLSARADRPFIPVSCGAIPADLAENELFGHEAGAFTGAGARQPGLVAAGRGGTLFLDDVDCLAGSLQAKLLRLLQEGEYRMLGSPRVHRADVRILSSSNRDLWSAVRAGDFRTDLYHRLHVVPIQLPALRERRDDIPLLVGHFLSHYADLFDRPLPRLSKEALTRLALHDWPGNVRELKHAIERALVLSEGDVLEPRHFLLGGPAEPRRRESFQAAKARVVRRFEREYLQTVLRIHRGNITHAARAANKNRRAFFELIRKHGIDVDRFRTEAR